MRIWAVVAVALQMVCSAGAADSITTVAIEFATTPPEDATVTVNGSTRTFKTVVTDAATQVAIGADAELSAAALVTQLETYRFSGISAHRTDGVVTLVGTVNQTITASVSASGSWATATVTTENITSFPLKLPIESMAAPYREPMGNHLVAGIETFATSVFGASTPALANFFALAGNELVTGDNIFSGANIFSNLTQQFVGGTITNVVLGATTAHIEDLRIYGPLYLTNVAPAMVWYQAGGAADAKMAVQSHAGGQWKLDFYTDDGGTQNNVITIGRSGATPTTMTIVPTILNPVISGGTQEDVVSTNGFNHSTILWADAAHFLGQAAISNAAPQLRLFETDGTTDLRSFDITMAAGVMKIRALNDAGTATSTAMEFSPGGGVVYPSSVEYQGDVTLSAVGGLMTIDGFFYASEFISAGDLTPTGAPSGFIGLYLADGAGAYGNPSEGFTIFSVGGTGRYRTDESGEGDGADQYFHNRTETVAGSGTDYTFTGSTAAIDFGGTDPTITLPTAGTYWVTATVRVIARAADNDEVQFKLRNTTTAADVANSDVVVSALPASKTATVVVQGKVVATTSSNVIALYGHNATTAAGTVDADGTRISYVRLH